MLDVVLVARDGEVGPLLEQLAGMGLQVRVVLVHDGRAAGDHPGLRIHALRSDAPRGRALLQGLLEVAALPGEPDDAVVTITSPRTLDGAAIPGMLRALQEGAGLVVASKFAPGGRVRPMPWHARFLIRLTYGVLGFLFPIEGVRDYTSGYRAFRRSLLMRALQVHGERLIEMPGQTGVTELLVRLARFGVRAVEVPLHIEDASPVSLGLGKLLSRAFEYLRLIRRLLH